MSTLEIKNLHAQVLPSDDNAEPKPILKGVNLTVNSGEKHAIMGPNGSGKSTLAYTLGGHPRYEVTEGEVLLDGVNLLDLEVDERQGSVRYRGAALELTRREFELLAFLCASPGRVFSRADLLDRVWGEDFLGTERTVDQHVAQLRALLGADLIETVRGRGYRLKASG